MAIETSAVEEVRNKLRNIIAELLGYGDLSNLSIDDNSSLGELGLDSLDMVSLIMAVEEEYKIEIPDEEAEFKTFGDLIRYIAAHAS